MHALVLNGVLACAALVAVLGLVDWFLTEKQKRALSDWSIRAWNWVDEAKKTRLLLKFKLQRPRFALLMASAIGAAALQGSAPPNFADIGSREALQVGSVNWWIAEAVIAICLVVQTIFVLPWLLDGLTESYDFNQKQGRSFRGVLFAQAVLMTLFAFAVSVVAGVLMRFDLFVCKLIGLLAGVFALTSALTMFLMWWFILLAKIALAMAHPILASSEFLVRRIAESPKGPLAAITGLIGGVAGLLKLFVG
jgi:hypothetical protein